MAGRVVPFKLPKTAPTREELLVRVRNLAANSANIRWEHPHIRQRMDERNISMRQALEVLRKGKAISGPTQDDYGDWRLKLLRKVAGRRVQVVVAVLEKHLTVVTVI